MELRGVRAARHEHDARRTGAARPKTWEKHSGPSPLKNRSLVFEQRLKGAVRRRAGESIEGPGFRKILRRANESAPGGTGQRAADAHTADAEIDLSAFPAFGAWVARVQAQPGFLVELYPYSMDPHASAELP